MKLIKYLFFLFLIGVIGFSIYVATLDGKILVRQSLTIDAPQKMLFHRVNNFTTWKDWVAPNADFLISLDKKTSGENASFSWNYNKITGSLTNTKVFPKDSIQQKIVSHMPFGKTIYQSIWGFKKGDKGTRVTWTVKGEQSFGEKAYRLINGRPLNNLAAVLKKSLQKLDSEVQKAMEQYDIKIEGVTQFGGKYYLYMTTASRNTRSELREKNKLIIPEVRSFMKANNIPISGSPIMVYNKVSPKTNTVIVSSGIPTPDRVITPSDSDVLCEYLPSQAVLKIVLKGHYKHLGEAWKKAKVFIQRNGYKIEKKGNAVEVYLTNTEKTANPAKWKSLIYIPVTVE